MKQLISQQHSNQAYSHSIQLCRSPAQLDRGRFLGCNPETIPDHLRALVQRALDQATGGHHRALDHRVPDKATELHATAPAEGGADGGT